jgi:hypothetical protein
MKNLNTLCGFPVENNIVNEIKKELELKVKKKKNIE